MDQPRNPHAPITVADMILHGRGLGRHGPASCVRAPRSSHGYDFVALPWIRGRGAPNAGCSPFRSPF
jgi:hypothetical protein